MQVLIEMRRAHSSTACSYVHVRTYKCKKPVSNACVQVLIEMRRAHWTNSVYLLTEVESSGESISGEDSVHGVK